MPAKSLAALVLAACVSVAAAAADDWLPVTPQDLALKPKAGEDAAILYTEHDTDDTTGVERSYVRLKVFTEGGTKYGNIEIPYVKDFTSVEELEARTVRPDGSIVPFSGQVYDKLIVKNKWLKFRAKTLTLPGVQAGSIIEYRYKYRRPMLVLASTEWLIERPLPVRKAKFSIRPFRGPFAFTGTVLYLPMGVGPELTPDRRYVLEMTDVPAFEEEPYMPPEGWLKMQVRFYYTTDDLSLAPEAFWQAKAKQWSEWAEKFMAKHKAVDEEARRLLVPGDTAEAKLRKLYARAQQVRNLGFDRSRTEKEAKRQKLKDNEHVDDVLKRGYGNGLEINLLFAALVRAAGYEAGVAWLSRRDRTQFMRHIKDPYQLNGDVVVVRADGKTYFLDPGVMYASFGELIWSQTDVPGLLLKKDGSGEFIQSPQAKPADAVTQRKAALRLSEAGDLEGTLRVTYTGLEALERRIRERHEDATGRKEALEAEVKSWLPATAHVEMKSAGPWETGDQPLAAEFEISVPNFATTAGSRTLLPLGIFQGKDAHPFRHSTRKHPVYFSHPFREQDEISVALPAGWKATLPAQPREERMGAATYRLGCEVNGNTLLIRREFDMEKYLFQPAQYPTLRTFYDRVRVGDQDSAVIGAATIGEAR